MPWKNGRGSTDQIVREDSPDGRMMWRASIADVTEVGGFSRFEGYERILTLLNSSGFTLDIDGQSTVLSRPGQAAQFAGEADVRVTRVDLPSRDFNIITLRDCVSATVRSYTMSSTTTWSAIAGTPHRILIVAATGTWQVHDCHSLTAGSAMLVSDITHESFSVVGSGLVCVAAINVQRE